MGNPYIYAKNAKMSLRLLIRYLNPSYAGIVMENFHVKDAN